MHYKAHYDQHHLKLSEAGEAEVINYYEQENVPIVVQRSSSGKAATKTASGDTGAATDRHSGLLQEPFLIRGRYP